jgi:hypothetical protein
MFQLRDGQVYSESEIYWRQMLFQRRGFPLYDPVPQISLPEAYQKLGVSIGDVGTITPEGTFDFFFNIFHPCDDPINANNTPEGFTPLALYDAKDIFHYKDPPGTHVSTSTVSRLDVDAPLK